MRPLKDRPVYGISYYGIPNFVQAFCLTGYLLGRFFIFDLYCLETPNLRGSEPARDRGVSDEAVPTAVPYREQNRSRNGWRSVIP